MPPNSRTGELRGGTGNGRTQDLYREGSRVDRIAVWGPRPVLFTPGEELSTTAATALAIYVRAGLNTITGNWVYRPEYEARTNTGPAEPLAA